MLIATSSVAVALLAAPALAESPIIHTLPPMIINVTVAADIPSTLVSRVLNEAGDIWKAAGIALVWQRGAADVASYARVLSSGPRLPSTLRVIVGHERGRAREENTTPLGWIVFDDPGTPQQDIYVSYINARALIEQSRGVVGRIDLMPHAEIETYLGRAMGRALAHEIGHYLLASKVHTRNGLMQARRTSSELFGADRRRFGIEVAQREAIAARLAPAPVVSGGPQGGLEARP
jgi:hypothetical protein